MWRRNIICSLGSACALVLGAAREAPAYSLADLLSDPVMVIDYGGVRFTNFRDWESHGFDGASAIVAADIDVAPLEHDGGVGLKFESDAFNVHSAQTRQLAWAFDVEVAGAMTHLIGGGLYVEGVSLDDGQFLITRKDFGEDLTGAEKLLAASAVQGDPTALLDRNVTAYFPRQGRIVVRTELALVSLPEGGAEVESFVETVRIERDPIRSQAVPEPSVAALAALGGLGLVSCALRRRREGRK